MGLKESHVKDYLFSCIGQSLVNIAKDTEAMSHFEKLHISLVKDIIIYSNGLQKDSHSHPINFRLKITPRIQNQATFKVFAGWYEKNKAECSKEDLDGFMQCISLDLFLPSELIKTVKPTGLFQDEEIDKRILQLLYEMDEIVITREKNVST